jgi:hypothetical protein
MDLEEEIKYSALMPRKIKNLAKENTPEEENKTPQFKETHPEASGANPESLIPQVSSVPMVNLILPCYDNSVPV